SSQLEEATGELRDALLDILTGSIRQRRLGVGVLMSGVLTATGANILSLYVGC
ncbi:MAG: hypothetical protein H0W36_09385, partial [Gemmatimonadetes bacterium]|nr:hypothetical protein [Gemmatimonadota bacterium]